MTIMMQPASSPQDDEGTKLKNPLADLLQSQQDGKLVQWGMSQYAQMKRDRLPTERQWFINMAFYAGKQNVQLLISKASTSNFQLNVPKAPPWRVRMVSNKLRPICRHEMSRLTAQKPIFTVVPRTTEDEDYSAARVGETIFTAVYSDKHVARELRRAVWWEVITGIGLLKSFWDPDAEDEINEQRGDIIIERINPFQLFVPDLDEEEIEKQPYVLHVTTKSPEWVKSTFDIDASPDTVAAPDVLMDSFLNLTGSYQATKKNRVLVLEYWIKPGGHKDYPNGGLFTIIGNKLVRGSDTYPYKHAEYPFYKLDGIPSGKFYADSVITDLVPLQREYNRTKSQIIEAKNIMAKPRLIAPRGSVNPRQITSEPGQVILYTPGLQPPTPLPMAPLPSYVLEELSRLQSDMDDISAQHEISRGQAPSQITAATAISYLQEQDDTKLAYQIASIEAAIQKLGRHVLKYVTQFWKTERLVRVAGKDGAFEAYHWKANDLAGNTDLRVEAGSALPRSKAAKQAFVMDLMKLGIIQPQDGLDMLDIGNVDKIYEDYLTDKRQAQRENLKMMSIPPQAIENLMALQEQTMAGQMDQPDLTSPDTTDPMSAAEHLGNNPQALNQLMPVNTWDNHQAHVKFHNQFRKSQQFEMLDDGIKQLFEAHVQMHQYALQATQVQPQLPSGATAPLLMGPGAGQQAPQGSQPPQLPQAQQQPMGA